MGGVAGGAVTGDCWRAMSDLAGFDSRTLALLNRLASRKQVGYVYGVICGPLYKGMSNMLTRFEY